MHTASQAMRLEFFSTFISFHLVFFTLSTELEEFDRGKTHSGHAKNTLQLYHRFITETSLIKKKRKKKKSLSTTYGLRLTSMGGAA